MMRLGVHLKFSSTQRCRSSWFVYKSKTDNALIITNKFPRQQNRILMKLPCTTLLALAFFCSLAKSILTQSLFNPCPIRYSEDSPTKCRPPLLCGVINSESTCVQKPNYPPWPICKCTYHWDPVCCRFRAGAAATVTATEPNRCLCACLKGKLVFKGLCKAPPSGSGPCPLIIMPVCCYIEKFDLTYTATNSCWCKEANGEKIIDGICPVF